MMKTFSRFCLCLVTALPAGIAGAQGGGDSTRIPGDSVLVRARQLVSDGQDAEGRRLIDSVLRANTPDARIYAEALYWRGALAPTAAEAERDYRRLLIEAPMSPRAEDAILQLANLLQARGDRRGASDYLQRFMLTYANSPARPRVAISLVRLLFDQGPQQQARACEALRLGREAVPPGNLELRGQLDFYAPRCTMMVAEAPAPVSAPVPAPASLSDSAVPAPQPVQAGASSPALASVPTSFYSVQVAAYDSETAARRLVQVLADRGHDARVDGVEKPFRVRIGRFTLRAEAVKALADLKAHGQDGFVTIVSQR